MREKLTEGFKDKGSPDMKYYAYDRDDNIVHMPTKIIVKTFKSVVEASDDTNLSQSAISRRIKNKVIKDGYYFEYV